MGSAVIDNTVFSKSLKDEEKCGSIYYMSGIQDITKKILHFRDTRNWKQFNNSKDMALSLSLEASEVLEHFQWKTNSEIEAYTTNKKTEIGKELADVLYWTLLMAHDLNIDIEKVFNKKMKENALKYPISKSKSSKAKYTQL